MNMFLLLLAVVIGTATTAAPFEIAWNSQWPTLCDWPDGDAPPADAISKWGISVNAGNAFNGAVVSTLYNHPGQYTVGWWPSFFPNGTAVNGGSAT